jgi:hypothetical protein
MFIPDPNFFHPGSQRRRLLYSFYWFLPSLAALRGRGGGGLLAPCVPNGKTLNLEKKTFFDRQLILFLCREGQDYTVFQGNTSSSAHLTTLLVDGEFVLLGGRNLVHKLTLQDLRVGDLYYSTIRENSGVLHILGLQVFFKGIKICSWCGCVPLVYPDQICT